MAEHILDQEAPDLSRKLRSLSHHQQKEIVLEAARFAANMIPSLDLNTRSVLSRMSSGDCSPEEVRSILATSNAADDRYFELLHKGLGVDEWGKDFSAARLLRGIAVGFGACPDEDIADAIYEILKALDNGAELLTFIEGKLKGS